MKKDIIKFFAIAILMVTGIDIFAQGADSLASWEAGKAIAHGIATATGQEDNPIFVAICGAAPVVFMWVWHVTHLKKKHKKELNK